MPICQQPDAHLLLAQALHMRLASGGLHNLRHTLIYIYGACRTARPQPL